MTDKEDFASLLNQFEHEHPGSSRRDPKVGDKVRGKVVSIGRDHVLVDLGAKSEGAIETEGLTDAEGNLTVSVGDSIEAIVTNKDERTGTLLLGSKHGHRMHGSAEISQAFQLHLPVEGLVSGVTKGGVEVQIAGIRGFCPASQLDLRFIEEMETFVGQHLSFYITRYEGGRHSNLVLSRRALLEEEQAELAEETRARLEVGAVLPGIITSLKEYGAFVDLGGIEGMVHISELAFGRVKHPNEVVSVGQQVEVAVLRIEKTENPKHPEKIALSIRLQPFGAFVELEPGIEGLVHVSELGSERRIGHPSEVLNLGDQVEVRVISVDRENRRISLSLNTDLQTDSKTVEADEFRQYQEPKQSFGTLGDLLRESMKKKDQ
jgi:small subunit ribosomal protein S1